MISVIKNRHRRDECGRRLRFFWWDFRQKPHVSALKTLFFIDCVISCLFVFYTKKLRKTAFSIIFYYKSQKIWNRPTYLLVLSRIRRAYEMITFTSGNLHQVACKCDVMQIIRRVAWDPLFLMARIAYPDHPFPQKIPFQIPGFGVRIPPVKCSPELKTHLSDLAQITPLRKGCTKISFYHLKMNIFLRRASNFLYLR